MAGDPATQVARQRLSLARNLLDLKRYDDAIEQIGQVLELEPERIDALVLMGRAQILVGNPAEAEQVLERTAALAPENVEVLYLFALAQFNVGRIADAERDLNAVLARSATHTGALWLLCQLEMHRNRRSSAYDALRRLCDASTDQVFVHRAMGRVALWTGNKRLAAQHFERCLADRPDDAELLMLLARARAGQGSARTLDPLLRLLRAAPAHGVAAGVLERTARGHIDAVASVGSLTYVAVAVVTEVLAGVAHLLFVRVADAALLFVAYQAIRARASYELPPEAVQLVRRRRAVLWPFAVAAALGLLAGTTPTASIVAGFGGLSASRAALWFPRLWADRSLRNKGRVLVLGTAGVAVPVAVAAMTWRRLDAGRVSMLAIEVAITVAGLAWTWWLLGHPRPEQDVTERSLPAGFATTTLVAALLPWWILLGALAAPFLVFLWPLLLAGKVRRGARLGALTLALLAGLGPLVNGAVAASVVVILGGSRVLAIALVLAGVFTVLGLRASVAVWRARVPDWMRLDT